MVKEDICEIKNCRSPGDLYFYDRLICSGHYNLYCDGKYDLKAAFFIVPKNSPNRVYKDTHEKVCIHTHTLKDKDKGVLIDIKLTNFV